MMSEVSQKKGILEIINRANTKLGKFQFLTGQGLKIIACISMFIDHFSKIFLGAIITKLFWMVENGEMPFEQYQSISDFVRFRLYAIGTIAFPIFCFLLAEGFIHTKNKKRYIGSMLIFAFISEIPFDLGFFSELSSRNRTFPFYFLYQNVFFTLFLGLCCLFVLERLPNFEKQQSRKENFRAVLLQLGTVALIAVVANFLKCDYGSMGIIFIAGFYFLRKNRILQALGYLILYMATTGNQPTICILIATLLILLYNGKRGKLKLKYFFYWFYPVHIFLIYCMTQLFV